MESIEKTELMADETNKSAVPDRVLEHGGLRDGVARQVARDTGVPEADVYGVASFFHLLSDPDIKLRVCTGLTCRLNGAQALLDQAIEAGMPAAECNCLAACDRPVAVLRDRTTLPDITAADLTAAAGDWTQVRSAAVTDEHTWRGYVFPAISDPERCAVDLAGQLDYSGDGLRLAAEFGADKVLEHISASGLQGRGGAGFPAGIKWSAVHKEPGDTKYIVLNADEGEPATFKDRDVMMCRPDRVIEGLAIAARTVGAVDIYLYLRGEFQGPWRALETAIKTFEDNGLTDGLNFHLHAGHGAYICGEETALIEALEGGRGMPRLKPPYPTQFGLWGKPTLVHNVETIACVTPILQRGADWFRDLGRTGAGSKLYCISGHVERPGTYELPLGVTLDELVEAAGGYIGQLKAFSPGGASSGFLPATERGRALDFKALSEVDSMLGSAGVLVLNDTVDMPSAVKAQLEFFKTESCGQCAPCRIGTRFQERALDRLMNAVKQASDEVGAITEQIEDVAWEMNEGSICGLGMVAALPLTSAMRWFPKEFVS
jgi:NADH:ubiquinone oxidoreductase subunit F (NADH-binding)